MLTPHNDTIKYDDGIDINISTADVQRVCRNDRFEYHIRDGFEQRKFKIYRVNHQYNSHDEHDFQNESRTAQHKFSELCATMDWNCPSYCTDTRVCADYDPD